MSSLQVAVFVPKRFGKNTNRCYILPVTSRGEMYHLRAAMALEPMPLILLEHTTAASNDRSVKQLVDYLVSLANHMGQDVFLTPWTANELTDLTRHIILPPENAKGCRVWDAEEKAFKAVEDPKEFNRKLAVLLKEFKATEIIRDNADVARTRPAMGKNDIPEDHRLALNERFASLDNQDAQHKVFPPPPKDKTEQRVLVLHRNSGELNGVYPEYDSGDALPQILKLLESIVDATHNPNRKLSAIICGDAAIEPYPSTGAYWNKLASLDIGLKNVPQRSLEAYYFQWAYDTGHFHMVVGFRSGALDLFTFLGIPTVSIGLRNGVGEIRHSWLAQPNSLQRLNVQYDLPRHNATAWRLYRGPVGRKLEDKLKEGLESPYWRSEPPADVKPRPKRDELAEEAKKKMLAMGPEGFQAFDLRILDLGLRLACARFLGFAAMVKRFDSKQYSGVITALDLRISAPVDTSEDKFPEVIGAVNVDNNEELKIRGKKLYDLQESDDVYQKFYVQEFLDPWGK